MELRSACGMNWTDENVIDELGGDSAGRMTRNRIRRDAITIAAIAINPTTSGFRRRGGKGPPVTMIIGELLLQKACSSDVRLLASITS